MRSCRLFTASHFFSVHRLACFQWQELHHFCLLDCYGDDSVFYVLVSHFQISYAPICDVPVYRALALDGEDVDHDVGDGDGEGEVDVENH